MISEETKANTSEDTLSKGGVVLLLLCTFLYLGIYIPIFYWLQHVLYHRSDAYLYSSCRYTTGFLATFLCLQIPMGGYVLFALLRRRRPQMHKVMWILLALFNVPAFFLLPAYRSIDSTGLHQGLFYGVSKTTPWSGIRKVSIQLYGVKGSAFPQYLIETKSDPEHPVYLPMQISDVTAEGAIQIDLLAKSNHIPEQYPDLSQRFAKSQLLFSDTPEWDYFVESMFVDKNKK